MAVTLFRFDQASYTSSPTMATTFGTGTPGPTYTNLVMVLMFSNSPGATSSPGAGWTLLARTETLASSNRSIENYIGGNPQYVVAEQVAAATAGTKAADVARAIVRPLETLTGGSTSTATRNALLAIRGELDKLIEG